MLISTCLIFCSKKFLKRKNTELCAAKGVLFLAPLKPHLPDDDQINTLPLKSAMEIMEKILQFVL
jgi:hypothetical protein